MINTAESTHHVFSLSSALGIAPLWVAGTILAVIYIFLIFEDKLKINQAVLAMIGAALMVVLGVINQKQAVEGIDFNTMALLIGMMIVVSITGQSGMFQYVAIKSAKLVNANPMGILLMLTLVTAVFSAMLDNVTTVLLIAPVTLLISDALGLKVFPFFFAEIFASNIGGTATLIGDPPNIIIGSEAGLAFNDFLYHLLPISLISMVVLVIVFYLVYKDALGTTPKARQMIMEFREKEAITDATLLKKSLLVIFLVILGFTVGHNYGIEPGTSALTGGGLLMLLAFGRKPKETQAGKIHEIFSEVEWGTIFFFAGLFIIVAGVQSTGILNTMGQQLLELTKDDLMTTTFLVLWISGLLSVFFNNIPFVVTMLPLIQATAPTFGGEQAIEPLWWALALGACFGGNGSLIGASANLTVAAFAEKAKQPISFQYFFVRAFPLTVLTLILSNIYIWLRYF